MAQTHLVIEMMIYECEISWACDLRNDGHACRKGCLNRLINCLNFIIVIGGRISQNQAVNERDSCEVFDNCGC